MKKESKFETVVEIIFHVLIGFAILGILAWFGMGFLFYQIGQGNENITGIMFLSYIMVGGLSWVIMSKYINSIK